MSQTDVMALRAPLLIASVGVVVAVLLAGCATTSAGTPADAEAIAADANRAGIAPELVYTTDVEGYDLAPQSVGPGAESGMSATWFNATTGAVVTIRTDSGEMTDASCTATPMWDVADSPVECTEEADGIWHRTAGGIHEYIAARDGVLVRVTGDSGTPQADLLAAASAVRVPSGAELDVLFSDLRNRPSAPIERGDLPKNGDGAPIDPGGEGG
jgi:hypothetical protein